MKKLLPALFSSVILLGSLLLPACSATSLPLIGYLSPKINLSLASTNASSVKFNVQCIQAARQAPIAQGSTITRVFDCGDGQISSNEEIYSGANLNASAQMNCSYSSTGDYKVFLREKVTDPAANVLYNARSNILKVHYQDSGIVVTTNQEEALDEVPIVHPVISNGEEEDDNEAENGNSEPAQVAEEETENYAEDNQVAEIGNPAPVSSGGGSTSGTASSGGTSSIGGEQVISEQEEPEPMQALMNLVFADTKSKFKKLRLLVDSQNDRFLERNNSGALSPAYFDLLCKRLDKTLDQNHSFVVSSPSTLLSFKPETFSAKCDGLSASRIQVKPSRKSDNVAGLKALKVIKGTGSFRSLNNKFSKISLPKFDLEIVSDAGSVSKAIKPVESNVYTGKYISLEGETVIGILDKAKTEVFSSVPLKLKFNRFADDGSKISGDLSLEDYKLIENALEEAFASVKIPKKNLQKLKKYMNLDLTRSFALQAKIKTTTIDSSGTVEVEVEDLALPISASRLKAKFVKGFVKGKKNIKKARKGKEIKTKALREDAGVNIPVKLKLSKNALGLSLVKINYKIQAN